MTVFGMIAKIRLAGNVFIIPSRKETIEMEKSVYSRKSRKKHTVNKVCAWMLAVFMLFSALPTGSMTVQATDAESVTYWTDNAATAFESTYRVYKGK